MNFCLGYYWNRGDFDSKSICALKEDHVGPHKGFLLGSHGGLRLKALKDFVEGFERYKMEPDPPEEPDTVRKYMSKCCLEQIVLESPGTGDLATVCSHCRRRVGHV